MTRHLYVPIACVLALAACASDPGDPYTSLTSLGTSFTTNNMDTAEAEDTSDDMGTTGDGDGDGAEDPTTTEEGGDGDGDGDTTGDGDGDGDAGDGDGDGDPTTGDGDGDQQMSCGWFDDPSFPGYYCDGSGEDPEGVNPIDCPPGLQEGGPCGDLTGAGCCDSNGDNWYCGDDGNGNTSVVFAACG